MLKHKILIMLTMITLIICIGITNADVKLTSTDNITNTTDLQKIFGTTNTTIIKNKLFTELQVNDAKNKYATYTMNNTKIEKEKTSMTIQFKEYCGKVISYELVTKDKCWYDKNYTTTYDCETTPNLTGTKNFTIRAKIQRQTHNENPNCPINGYSYMIDWQPVIKINNNILVKGEWEWWNDTYTHWAYYSFDNTSITGTNLSDLSPNNNYATLYNLANMSGTTAGIIDQGLRLNGTGYAWMSKSLTSGNFTIIGYYNMSSRRYAASNYIAIVGGSPDYINFYNESTYSDWDFYQGASHHVNYTRTLNVYKCYAFRYNGTHYTFYDNGTFVGNKTHTGNMNITYLFTDSYGDYFNGTVDEIGIINSSLSADDINETCANIMAGNRPFEANYTISVQLTSPNNLSYSLNNQTPYFEAFCSGTAPTVSTMELFINGTGYGYNGSYTRLATDGFTANATLQNNTEYTWWINCTGSGVVGKSEERKIYVTGYCGNGTGNGSCSSCGDLTFATGCYGTTTGGTTYVSR